MKTFWFAFVVGFACGLIAFCTYNQSPKVTHEHIKSETFEEKIKATEVQQQTSQETVTTKKTYYPTGALKSETTTSSSQVNLAKETSVEKYSLNVLTDIKKTEQDIQTQKDLMVGISYPLLDFFQPFNYQQMTILIGYRLFYNFYIFGEFNLGLSRYSLGIMTFI